MVQQPSLILHKQSATQSGKDGNNDVQSAGSVIENQVESRSGNEHESVLTNNLSVGLPSEGPVSACIDFCSSS